MDRELAQCPCLNIEIGGSGARCRVGMLVEGLNILSIYGPLPGLAAFFFVQEYVLLQSFRPICSCLQCCKTAAEDERRTRRKKTKTKKTEKKEKNEEEEDEDEEEEDEDEEEDEEE